MIKFELIEYVGIGVGWDSWEKAILITLPLLLIQTESRKGADLICQGLFMA